MNILKKHSTIFIIDKEDMGMISYHDLARILKVARFAASCQSDQENTIIKSKYKDPNSYPTLDNKQLLDLIEENLNLNYTDKPDNL